MGVVYKAYDPELDRAVALKLLRVDPGSAQTTLSRDRLLREAQALARLSHPNVVAIHEVGSYERGGGQHVFLAMEFVDGQTLRRWLHQQRSPREIIDAFAAAGEGLAAAHRAGLVHRDFKPDNVIVGSDGRVRVLDFGLVRAAGLEAARESVPVEPAASAADGTATVVGGRQGKARAAGNVDPPSPPAPSERGSASGRGRSARLSSQLTRAGSVMGTPRYMAPEQHRGLPADERADQFSFCLALYEALYGVDPFHAEMPVNRLEAVLVGRVGPPPSDARVGARLRRLLLRGLAVDPAARWPSLEVLLAELRKDPAAAWRKAAVVSVSTLALASALIVGGWAIHTRRVAARQAQLAHEFGLEQAQIASAARNAALLPLHDLRPEMDAIRERMAAIEAKMKELGRVAAGPGHAALGHGDLALERWEDAVRELEAALETGYRSPDLSYALGLAHGKLYQKKLYELVKTDDAAADAAKRAAIERAHREPALRHLTDAGRAAGPAIDAPPEYAQGLIALYEERFDDALALARKAAARMPALFEARTLEGDVQMAISHDRSMKGDTDGETAALERAGTAYRAATEMARSSYSVRYGECKRLVAVAAAQTWGNVSPEPSVKAALAACDEAATVRPDETGPLVWKSGAWAELGDYQASHGIDPSHAFDEVKRFAEAALRIDPKEVRALQKLSWVHLHLADYQRLRGGDPRGGIELAITYARRALELDPTDFSLYNNLAYAYAARARDEIKRGLDPRASFAAELECGRQQRRYFPNSLAALDILQYALSLAQWQRDHGINPDDAFKQGILACEERIALAPKAATGHVSLCFGEWVYSTYLALVGTDPRPHLERAIGECKQAITLEKPDWIPWLDLAVSDTALARWQLETGGDPKPAIDEARDALARAVAIDPNHLNYRYVTELETVAARAQMARGADPSKQLSAAEAAARKVLAADEKDPDVLRALADAERWRAEWLSRARRPIEAAVREGLKAATRAESLNPDVAESFATEGALHLIEARAALKPTERERAALQAQTALEKALTIDSFLSRLFRPLYDEAVRLAASPSAATGSTPSRSRPASPSRR
jgi:serine/threonine-protein kinase